MTHSVDIIYKHKTPLESGLLSKQLYGVVTEGLLELPEFVGAEHSIALKRISFYYRGRVIGGVDDPDADKRMFHVSFYSEEGLVFADLDPHNNPPVAIGFYYDFVPGDELTPISPSLFSVIRENDLIDGGHYYQQGFPGIVLAHIQYDFTAHIWRGSSYSVDWTEKLFREQNMPLSLRLAPMTIAKDPGFNPYRFLVKRINTVINETTVLLPCPDSGEVKKVRLVFGNGVLLNNPVVGKYYAVGYRSVLKDTENYLVLEVLSPDAGRNTIAEALEDRLVTTSLGNVDNYILVGVIFWQGVFYNSGFSSTFTDPTIPMRTSLLDDIFKYLDPQFFSVKNDLITFDLDSITDAVVEEAVPVINDNFASTFADVYASISTVDTSVRAYADSQDTAKETALLNRLFPVGSHYEQPPNGLTPTERGLPGTWVNFTHKPVLYEVADSYPTGTLSTYTTNANYTNNQYVIYNVSNSHNRVVRANGAVTGVPAVLNPIHWRMPGETNYGITTRVVRRRNLQTWAAADLALGATISGAPVSEHNGRRIVGRICMGGTFPSYAGGFRPTFETGGVQYGRITAHTHELMAGINSNYLGNGGSLASYIAAPMYNQVEPPARFNATETTFRVLNGVRNVLGSSTGQDVAGENISLQFWIRTN